MGPFDQTARQASKDNGLGFFDWLLPLRSHLVAILGWAGAPGSARLIVEVKAEPESGALIQVGVYELRADIATHCSISPSGCPYSPLAMCKIAKLSFVAGAELPKRYLLR